jgi:hypothetical protein
VVTLWEALFGIKKDDEPIDKSKPVSWFDLDTSEQDESHDRGWTW